MIGAMALSIKCLLHKLADLSPDPQYPYAQLGEARDQCILIISVLGKQETGGSLVLAAQSGYPNWRVSGQWEKSSKRITSEDEPGRNPLLTSDIHKHGCAHACLYTHARTHSLTLSKMTRKPLNSTAFEALHRKSSFPWLPPAVKPSLGTGGRSSGSLIDHSWGKLKSGRTVNFRAGFTHAARHGRMIQEAPNFASSSRRILCKWTFQELCRRWHYSITRTPVPDHSLELIL